MIDPASIKRRLSRAIPALSYLTYEIRCRRNPQFRAKRRVEDRQVEQLTRSLGSAGIAAPLSAGRNALIISIGQVGNVPLEGLICAAFEANGLRPVVIGPRHLPLRRALRLMSRAEMASFADFLPNQRPTDDFAAHVRGLKRVLDLMDFSLDGVTLGKFALSTGMRQLRDGTMDLGDPRVVEVLASTLADSVTAHRAARAMLDKFNPAAVLMIDRGYTPNGEIAENCLQRGIPVFTYNAGHRNNVQLFKRYHTGNTLEHYHALSDATWARLQASPWTDAMQERLLEECEGPYKSQEWYAEVGTQRRTRVLGREEVMTELGLDPGKKVAAIFPHIFWDATFFWGIDLYPTYETWFRAALKAAASNDKLNWVVKIHPANRVKSVRDGHMGMHSEEEVAREVLGGEIPPHIRLLPADTTISTLSLFDILDYCLTVRGTVGIECAARGITVLTCGTGRYDRRGFTVDFTDTESYLTTLARLHELPSPTPEQVISAKKFAYGTFVLRPTTLSSVRYVYGDDEIATLWTEVLVKSRAELADGRDVRGLAAFFASGEDDFCNWDLHARLSASAGKEGE